MLRSSCTGTSEFPPSESNVSGGTRPEVGIPTRKVGGTSAADHVTRELTEVVVDEVLPTT